MQQAMQQEAMRQQAMQQQAMQQQAMQQQAMQQQQQMSPQMQQQLQQQLINQQLQQQMSPQMIERMQQQSLQQPKLVTESKDSLFDINSMMFSNRDSLVLLLLYLILLTPQVNSMMNKIPYTSDDGQYPSYLGILLRGFLFISAYISMKKLNLI
jgi:hypothetical protein